TKDLPVGASAVSIQAAINAVALTNPTLPGVIHFPAGNYSLGQAVTIPANANLFLVGDNTKTGLSRIDYFPGYLIVMNGPSKTTIRDMSIGGEYGNGIVLLDADQPGARVFGEGLYMSTNT